MVVDLETPGAALDPVAQLPAAAEPGIDKGRVDVVDRALVPEPDPGSAPDQLLPQRPRAGGHGVGLELERSLESDRVEQVSEKQRRARGRDEDLEGVRPADRYTGKGGGLETDYPDAIDLPGEAAADKTLDDQTRADRPGRLGGDGGHVVDELRPGVVPPDPHRAIKTLLVESRLEVATGLDGIVRVARVVDAVVHPGRSLVHGRV